MSQKQGTVLRNGKIIDSSSDTALPEDLNMAQTNPNDSDTNDGSDISSQLSEIKESYERRINELHQEFSQLKDLMMAIVNKNNSESEPSSSKGPSKPPQQLGSDSEQLSVKQRLLILSNLSEFQQTSVEKIHSVGLGLKTLLFHSLLRNRNLSITSKVKISFKH